MNFDPRRLIGVAVIFLMIVGAALPMVKGATASPNLAGKYKEINRYTDSYEDTETYYDAVEEEWTDRDVQFKDTGRVYFSPLPVRQTADELIKMKKPSENSDLGKEKVILRYGQQFLILQPYQTGTSIDLVTDRQAYDRHYPIMVNYWGGGTVRSGSVGGTTVRGGGLGAGK